MRILGKYFGVFWLTLSAIVFASVLIPPTLFQYASIMSFAIPVIIGLSMIMLLLTIFFKSRHWYFYLIVLLIAWPFYSLTVQFNKGSNAKESGNFSLLSYNVKWFTEAKENNYEDIINWIIDQKADFMCFQEYYPERKISERIIDRGGYYDATDKKRYNVAIFSKYPIIDKGLLLGDDKLNNILYADVKYQSDTIRLYSIHLESMGINPDKLQDRQGIRNEYDDVKFRLLSGSRTRSEQVDLLLQHVQSSPYPVVLAGDFNDIPFSHNYFTLKKSLKNAFEEKGRGFGVTYNGKIPFLRIDNQFFGDGLEILQFHTINNVYYSDHYPLLGNYRMTD